MLYRYVSPIPWFTNAYLDIRDRRRLIELVVRLARGAVSSGFAPEGVRLDARKNGQIAESDLVRDRKNAGSHCAAHLWLPGTPAVCYRPHCSGVHLGNVG
jgi:hypothetical protein